MKILVLNSGSSSQKARFYDLKPPLPDDPPEPQWDGKLEWRDDRATFEIRASSGAVSNEGAHKLDRPSATAQLLGELASGKTRVLASLSEIDVVGHRIVNGGRNCNQPTVITGEVKAATKLAAKSRFSLALRTSRSHPSRATPMIVARIRVRARGRRPFQRYQNTGTASISGRRLLRVPRAP